MNRQLNVQQQNEQVRAEIERCARCFSGNPAATHWLRLLLAERGLQPDDGMLVELGSTPEQEGDIWWGTWLTRSKAFWNFEVVVSRKTNQVISLEAFVEVTVSMLLSARSPGTGKSFGYLAIEVLDEAYHG